MTQPTRQTPAGLAYLDLQTRARRERRGKQELLTLYVVERWLARLSASPYAEQFVLKGGMLLAAYDARRPTADVDALARGLANDQDALVARITEVADQAADDGVKFLADTAVVRTIREDAFYPGVRVAMDSRIATAVVRAAGPIAVMLGRRAHRHPARAAAIPHTPSVGLEGHAWSTAAALLFGEGGCEFAVGADVPAVQGAAGRLGELE